MEEDLDPYLIAAEGPGANYRNPSGFQFLICGRRMRRLASRGHLLGDQPTSLGTVPGTGRSSEASSPPLDGKEAPRALVCRERGHSAVEGQPAVLAASHHHHSPFAVDTGIL